MNYRIRKIIPAILLLTNFIIVILSFRSSPFSKILNGHDSSMFMYFGKGMSEGLIPYVDMFDHKGIILFFIQQLGVTLGFGNYSFGVWIIELLFYLVSVLFIYKTSMLLTNKRIVSCLSILLTTGLILVTFDGGNYSEEFALTFISIAFFYFTECIVSSEYNKFHMINIGITGGLTFFIRSNMIALWIVFCLYFVLTDLIHRKFSALAKKTMYIFVGGFAVCLLVFFYALIKDNLSEMVYQTFTLNIQYSSESTFLDKLITTKSFLELASRFGTVTFLALFIFSTLVGKEKTNSCKLGYQLCLIVFMVINFLTVILSGRYYTHYFITMLPSIIVSTSLGIDGMSNMLEKRSHRRFLYLVLCIIPLSYSIQAFKGYTVNTMTSPIDQNENSETVSLGKYIKNNSNQNSPIYVHNINANIYLMSDRFSNSKFFVLPSLDYTKFEQLRTDFTISLSNNPPKFIAIRKESFNQEKPDDSRMDKTVIEFAKKNYSIISEFKKNEILLLEYNY